ncbi:fibronectin type III domain-containing protein [Citricoccus sp. SGAir0253]|nr:fibronectin type III domain-containing protein [Citricoccus sp. SGAir0253]
MRWDGLRNGVPYRFRIQASNRADEPSEWSPWSTDVTPAGRPFAPGTPTAVRDESVVDGGVVRVSWSAADDNGGALTGYTVTAYAGGRAVATRTVAPGTTGVGWAGLDTSTAYAFSVTATNAEGDSPSSGRSAAVTPFGLPGAVSGVTARATGTDRQLRLSFDGAAANGSPVTYQYAVSGGAWQSLGRSTAGTVTVPANGTSYRLSVRAVNDAGPGPTASVSAEPAHGPFRMPAITATAQEGGAKFTWSPTSAAAVGNGRPVTITPRVNGQLVDNDGEYTTDRFREAREFTMSIRVCAEGTEDCETATRAVTSRPLPDPTATVGVGGRYPADSCTENGNPDAPYTNCWYTTMAFSGMEPGPLQVTCTPRGSATSSRPGEVYSYKTGTVTIGADGRYSGTPEFCILHDGFADFRLTLPELGMESNVIYGPWP